MEVLEAPFLIWHAAFFGFYRRLIRIQVSRYSLGEIFNRVEILVHSTGRRRAAHTVPEEFPARVQQVNCFARESAAGVFAHPPGELPTIGFVPGMRQLVSDRPGGEGVGIVTNYSRCQYAVHP